MSKRIASKRLFGVLISICAICLTSLLWSNQAGGSSFQGVWTFTGSLANSRAGHTATLLQNGKLLVVGGMDTNYKTLSSCELYDPSTGVWTATGSLATGRYYHTATLLPNGKVLVVGGQVAHNGSNSSCEIYDPSTGNWTATGSLITGRASHTATLLQNGKVLVAGGVDASNTLSSSELYDPSSGRWTATANMTTGFSLHTATLLQNGQVLVAGGGISNGGQIVACDLYDPVGGTWSSTGDLNIARYSNTATLLSNGKVLVAGGVGENYSAPSISSCELYDPSTGTWTVTGSMNTSREDHSAALLSNGQVLVVGGNSGPGSTLRSSVSSCELFDPSTGQWTQTGDMNSARVGNTATLLQNGKALVTGGQVDLPFSYSPPMSSCEVFDPNASPTTPGPPAGVSATEGYGWAWVSFDPPASNGGNAITQYTVTSSPGGVQATGTQSPILVFGLPCATNCTFTVTATSPLGTGPSSTQSNGVTPDIGPWGATGSLATGRVAHTETVLQDGKVLVAGGQFSTLTTANDLASCEIYDPSTGTWTATGSMNTARECHTATLLPNGKVLVAGGVSNGTVLTSCEIYDPSTGTWSQTGSLIKGPTAGFTATLLQNGQVLLAGGWDGNIPATLATCELYDPATGTWSLTGNMVTGRDDHTATLLQNGKVLVAAGGELDGHSTGSCELYDPSTGTWSATGSMNQPRSEHTATLLQNGSVLVAGCAGASCELYDPSTGTWSMTGSMNSPRTVPTATLLANGKVLVVGGEIINPGSNATLLSSCELYDPSSGTWTDAGNLTSISGQNTLALLQDGKVLVVGGQGYNHLSLCDLFYPGLQATVPGTPSAVSATAGNSQATVSITPPATDGASAITSYIVTSSPGNITVSGPASPITVKGLTNGVAYTFTATASNGVGTSLSSLPSNSVTPSGSIAVNGVCGSSNGGTFTSAPTTNLCSAGNATSVSGSGPWTWFCQGENGGTTASCSANIEQTPVNGICGSSNGGTFTSAPTTNLCSAGNATAVSGSGPWTWSCQGENGGTTASCSANAPAGSGVCGSANGESFLHAPTKDLCSSGKASRLTGKGPWSWTCAGTKGGLTASCSASLEVNGACGSSNGRAYTSAPTSNFCKSGTASSITGNGPWSWTCKGANSGTNANCSAKIKVNGVCGSANRGNFGTQPDANLLCSAGSASTVTGKGPWKWKCAGANGGKSASCSANLEVNGTCGSSDGRTFTKAPKSSLCHAGKASKVTGTGPWNWSCGGINGGSTASCSADIQ